VVSTLSPAETSIATPEDASTIDLEKLGAQSRQRMEKAVKGKFFSPTMARVISIAASPTADLNEMTSLISADPALAARVIHSANSPAFASNRKMVASVPEAVKKIGFSNVRDVALAYGVSEVVPVVGNDFDLVRHWQHALAVARLCAELSECADKSAQRAHNGAAYLAGLCHDLGLMLFDCHFAAERRTALETAAASGQPIAEVERAILGVTRAELARLALSGIGLPDAVRLPIEALHRGGFAAGERASDRDLTGVLRLADSMAVGIGLAADGEARLAPYRRAYCRAAAGADIPAISDPATLRSEIGALTAMLGRLSPAQEADALSTLFPRRDLRIRLVKDISLSDFDPIASAIASMANLCGDASGAANETTADCGVEIHGMVIVTETSELCGRARERIESAARATGTPLLHIVALSDAPPPTAAGAVALRTISLSQIAAFIDSCDQAARVAAEKQQ
jgi:HD-like signal output (HDOD) protein